MAALALPVRRPIRCRAGVSIGKFAGFSGAEHVLRLFGWDFRLPNGAALPGVVAVWLA